ncbi:MAG: phytanoyl-CoA dioxygenase family protein [Candidatus Azotimanducaceae bacterium]|uniref:Phytanoyl-CoA dioxygenase n=1 Tax=OM182 bacterium TaxID=2510334 RepID=A0A520RZP4_9GAMM|nr:hypothetical protein [Gammaproteobacteria bacterium]RZO75691.1 MAG: hypothetical protein EVA68_06345 [OM182 bacterium]
MPDTENLMDTGAPTTEIGLDELWTEIRSLGLESYIKDLDTDGYTVIPPEIANPDNLCQRLLDVCLSIAETRSGVRPDLLNGKSLNTNSVVGDTLKGILLEDPVFEEALMNPALLAISTYLCGYDLVLSSLNFQAKSSSELKFKLHTDTRLPSPLPTRALLCKCIYALTDFNQDNGSTVFVPGSQRWARNPVGDEKEFGEQTGQHAIPTVAPAGSLIIFHGNTWHGAYNRKVSGLRASLHLLMQRSMLRCTEDFYDRVSEEMLERNSARFAILTQQAIIPPYIDHDDQVAKITRALKYTSTFEQESGIALSSKR